MRVHVLSGRITYDGQIGAGSKFSLETLSGGIEVLLPANAAFELDAEAFSGHVNSDFPITMQGTISPKELRGVVKPLILLATLNKSAAYPIGDKAHVMGVSVRGALKRSDFGMTYSVENGWVGDTVELIIELEARRQ